MVLREITSQKGETCNRILRALPEWFGIEAAIQHYVQEVESMPTFVVEADGQVAGFLSLNLHNEYTAEIHVMGVLPERHRAGAGRRLVLHAENYLRQRDFKFLTVKTLSPSRPNAAYQKTREFYFALGFRPLEEFKTLWGERNPCLMFAKGLS